MPPSSRTPTVLIIGAGLAGLTAAYELRTRGAEVRIVEARARIGGRVHTVRNSFQHDQHAEAGGELIEAEHRAVQDLARRFRLTMVPVLRRGFGQYIAMRDGRGRMTSEARSWDVFARIFARACDEYARAEHAPDSPITRAWARLSLDDALRRAQAPAPARQMAMALRGFFLAEPEELSLLMLLDQLREGGDPARQRMLRIAGGNDLLATALAKAIGTSAISLRHEAVAITQNSAGARVSIKDGHGQRDEAAADYVIVTVPAPIVRRIRFQPRLPEAQKHAIDALVYGRATKTLLQFARPFWRRTNRPHAFGTNLDVGAVWDGSEHQRGPGAILVSLAGGAASTAAQQLLRTPDLEGFSQQLRWLGGTARDRRVIASDCFVWEDDPWSNGGYAVFTPGFDPAWRRWLATPAGRVLFAGEHTSLEFQGYMNGAVLSGQRAALEAMSLWREQAREREQERAR
jgi:monoamine oxidase